MFTLREVHQRLSVNRIGLERYGSLQWRLSYLEDRNYDHCRLVDDLEEAVIVAGQMRKERDEQQAGDIIFRASVPQRYSLAARLSRMVKA